jgi:hypothetical protein
MKSLALIATIGALAVGAGSAQAQSSGIPITKDRPSTMTTTTSGGDIDWNGNLGYRLRPGGQPVYCAANDASEVAKISINADRYNSATMISPEQAKAIALCAVPGQISSGEMELHEIGTVYEITILPTGKQTHSKVEINAMTGEVINAKQFGGLRGLAGYLRESAERKNNKVAP